MNENVFSGITEIERGVRQGGIFSPDLFNLGSETILTELEAVTGLIIGGYNFNIR